MYLVQDAERNNDTLFRSNQVEVHIEVAVDTSVPHHQ